MMFLVFLERMKANLLVSIYESEKTIEERERTRERESDRFNPSTKKKQEESLIRERETFE